MRNKIILLAVLVFLVLGLFIFKPEAPVGKATEFTEGDAPVGNPPSIIAKETWTTPSIQIAGEIISPGSTEILVRVGPRIGESSEGWYLTVYAIYPDGKQMYSDLEAIPALNPGMEKEFSYKVVKGNPEIFVDIHNGDTHAPVGFDIYSAERIGGGITVKDVFDMVKAVSLSLDHQSPPIPHVIEVDTEGVMIIWTAGTHPEFAKVFEIAETEFPMGTDIIVKWFNQHEIQVQSSSGKSYTEEIPRGLTEIELIKAGVMRG